MSIDQIQKLIINNNINEAIKAYMKLVEGTSCFPQAIILSQKYQEVELSQTIGDTNRNNIQIEKAQISRGLLSALNQYKEGNCIKEASNNNTSKKKILFLYASPSGKSELRFSEEIRAIEDALQIGNRNTQFEFVSVGMVKADELSRLIRKHSPNILHISTHASIKKGLLFEDHNRLEFPLTVSEFDSLTSRIAKKENPVECIILNACNSAEHAKTSVKHIQHAIGTLDFIPDEAAVKFTKGFYETLFDGESYEVAFDEAIYTIEVSKIDPEGDIKAHEIPVLYTKSN